MIMDEVLVGPIKPTDLKIYYEDSIPYLDYKGIAETNYGKVEIHFPKMGLALNNFECHRETLYNGFGTSAVTITEYSTQSDEVFTIRILERDMTKKQIEKKLGYKVNIVEK